MVSKTADGKFVVKGGFPTMAELSSLTNLPAQKQTDPQLLKFLLRIGAAAQ